MRPGALRSPLTGFAYGRGRKTGTLSSSISDDKSSERVNPISSVAIVAMIVFSGACVNEQGHA